MVRNTPTVLDFMLDRAALSNQELRELQDAHECNFNSDFGSDLTGCYDWHDEADELEGLTIMESAEFEYTFCLNVT